MRHLKKSSLFIVMFLLLAGQGWAATVNRYVDSTVGSNGNGTIATPWKLFSDVNWTSGTNNIKADVDAGSDVVLNLKRGSNWTTGPTIGYSGASAAHPIVLQPYGTGDIPIIKGFSSTNKSNFTVNGVKFYNPNNNMVAIQTSGTDIIFNSCVIDGDTDFVTTTIYGFYLDGTCSATINNCDIIRVYTGAKALTTSTLAVNNCRIYGVNVPFAKDAGATLTYTNCHIAGVRATTTAIAGTDGGSNIIGGVIGVKNIWRYGNKYYNISIDDANASATYLNDLATAMATYGLKPTIGIQTGNVTAPSWAGLVSYFNSGWECLPHGWSHQYPSAPSLISIQYTGTGNPCELTISGTYPNMTLSTNCTGAAGDNLSLDLSPPADPFNDVSNYDMSLKLRNYLVSTGKYTSTVIGSGNVALTCSAAPVVVPDIKAASYTILADPDKLMDSELSMSKVAMGLKFSGWAGKTYIVPGGSYSTNGVDIIQTYYDGARNSQETGTANLRIGVDVSKIDVPNTKLGASEADIIKWAQGRIYASGLTGRVTAFYGHQTAEYTAAQWGYFLEGSTAIGATYATLDQMTAWVRSQTLVGGVGHVYTGTTDSLDLRLTASSSCKGAGSATYAPALDIYGKTFANPPSIGAMEYQGGGGGLSPGLGLSGGNFRPRTQ